MGLRVRMSWFEMDNWSGIRSFIHQVISQATAAIARDVLTHLQMKIDKDVLVPEQVFF
jgi:hypothetical protein